MRKWITGAATVLIGIFLAICAVARLAAAEGRAVRDKGQDVIWDNQSSSLNDIRTFLNARI